jgi:hypothetical protein
MRGHRLATWGVVLAALAAAGAARSAETTVTITVQDGDGRPVGGAAVGVLQWLREEC